MSTSEHDSSNSPPSKRQKTLLENKTKDEKSSKNDDSSLPSILNSLPPPRSWEEVPRSDWTVTFRGKEYNLHSFVLLRFDFFKGAERFPTKSSSSTTTSTNNVNSTTSSKTNVLEILTTNLDTSAPDLKERHSTKTFETLMDILYCDQPGKEPPEIDPEQAIPMLHLADFLGLNNKPSVCEAIAFDAGSKYVAYEADRLLAQLREFEPLPTTMLKNIVADLPLQDFVDILFCHCFPSPPGSEPFDTYPVCSRPYRADVCLDMILQFLEKEESSPAKQAKILQDIIEIGNQNFPRTSNTANGGFCIIPWSITSQRAQRAFICKLDYLFREPVDKKSISCFSEKLAFSPPLELLKNVSITLKEGHEREEEEIEYTEVPPTHIYHYYVKKGGQSAFDKQNFQLMHPINFKDGNDARYIDILNRVTDKTMALNVFLGLPQDESLTDLLFVKTRGALYHDDVDSNTIVSLTTKTKILSQNGLISWHPNQLLPPKQTSSDNSSLRTAVSSVASQYLRFPNSALGTRNVEAQAEEDESWKSRNIFQDAFEKALYPVDFCYETDPCYLFNYLCSFLIYLFIFGQS